MKQAITGYITALINTYSKKKKSNPIERECNTVFSNELNDMLDFVEDIPQNTEIITVVLDECNCKENIYKQALKEVLSNLRSIESPNIADSYINDSIEIIAKLLKEEK